MKSVIPGSIVSLVLAALIAACSTPPQTVSADPHGPPEELDLAKPEEPEESEPVRELTGTQAILTRIAAFLSQNDYDQAIALFDEIEEPDRESPGIQLLKASALFSAGKFGESRTVIQAILSNDAENPDALFVLSTIERAEGKTREQRQLLERIIKNRPDHAEALTALGMIFLENRSFRNAASYFDRALEADPQNGDALVGRAGVYRYQRQPQQAEVLLSRAIVLYPRWVTPLSDRARIYREAGALPHALADLDAAETIAPNNYWVLYDRGNIFLDMGKKPEALEEFQKAISVGPDNFLAYVYSAGIKDDLGDYDGAEQDYRAVIRLNPAYYFAFEGLGMLMMRRHAWSEARAAFQEAYKGEAAAPQEKISYALLAAANWMREGTLQAPKQFLQTALRQVERESLEWYVTRLYHDLSGDNDVAIRIDKEKSLDTKQRMLFYLALYYDVRNNQILANRYYLQVKEIGRPGTLEWRINEWTIQERNLNVD
ncbi:MAG: tetratricopeptide repeat protein [Treponema sp.]|nr:tetratricopeptide repeat protein [Treponema sp.]